MDIGVSDLHSSSPTTLLCYSLGSTLRTKMNVVVVVDVTVFIQTADSSMKVGNFAIGFLMQPNSLFAVSQIGLAGADFSVLAGKHLFVKLRS